MHYEYAIDPESITEDYKTFCFVMNQFGFSKGRLISMFSKKWKREVIELINKFERPKERKVATELLNKQLYIKSKREYDASLPWIDATLKAHQTRPFHALIANDNDHPSSCSYILSTEELWSNSSSLFNILKEKSILKVAEEFAKTTELLLRNSNEIFFIDPYFSTNHYKPLQAMLKSVNGGTTIKYFAKSSPNGETIEFRASTLEKDLPRYIPSGLILKVLLIEGSSTFRLHNRFVITNKGGIKFPDGLNELKNAKDIINLMEDETYLQIYNEFDELSRQTIVEEIEIIGRG